MSDPIELDALLEGLPRFLTKRQGAEVVTRNLYPLSHRSLEKWPLRWRVINGRSVAEAEELFRLALAKVDASLVLRGGRRKPKIAASANDREEARG